MREVWVQVLVGKARDRAARVGFDTKVST